MSEQIVVSTMSGVGQVMDEVCKARAEVAMMAANAKSAIGMVQTIIALFSAQAEMTTIKTIKTMEGRIQQVATYMDAQMSRATAQLK